MKIELIKEEQYGKAPWYEIRIDGEYIQGGLILSIIEKQYEELKSNPEMLKKKTEILKCEEIVLPLQEETNLTETKTEES